MHTSLCVLVLCKTTWGCEERIWALLSVCVPAPPVSLELDKGPGDNATLMQHSSVLLVFHSAAQ